MWWRLALLNVLAPLVCGVVMISVLAVMADRPFEVIRSAFGKEFGLVALVTMFVAFGCLIVGTPATVVLVKAYARWRHVFCGLLITGVVGGAVILTWLLESPLQGAAFGGGTAVVWCLIARLLFGRKPLSGASVSLAHDA